jgi:hypothetical protein
VYAYSDFPDIRNIQRLIINLFFFVIFSLDFFNEIFVDTFQSNEENERKQVTKLLAKMFSDEGSNLVEQNRPLWICFLGRYNIVM